jgi:predicted DNA binding CopG/RHH family protein
MTIRKAESEKVVNTLIRSHAVKWDGWMLCVDEWENAELRGGGASNLQAFYVHQSIWNEGMHYDDANRWDLDADDPLDAKLGVIELDDYWLHTGTSEPSVRQLLTALKNYLSNDTGILTETVIPNKLEKVLNFRVSFHELDRLKRKAKEAGTTVSNLIRNAVEQATNTANP